MSRRLARPHHLSLLRPRLHDFVRRLLIPRSLGGAPFRATSNKAAPRRPRDAACDAVALALVLAALLLPSSPGAAQKDDLDEFLLPTAIAKPAPSAPAVEPKPEAGKPEAGKPEAGKAAAGGKPEAGKAAAASKRDAGKPEAGRAAAATKLEAEKSGPAAKPVTSKSAPGNTPLPAESRSAAAPEKALSAPASTPAGPEPQEPAAEATSGASARRSRRAGAAQERAERVARAKADKPRRVKKKTAYDLISDKWHEPAPAELSAAHEQAALPELVFIVQKTGERFTLKPASRAGGFDDTQLAVAKHAFSSWGPTPHPRVLDLVYAATLHFNAPYVTLISGIRKDRNASRHSHGLAADVVLPGVEDETLAAYFRAQGFCGVGTYPRSHFVHIDTRDQSYFWIDNSKPNQRGRVVQVRKDESTAADDAARARGTDGFINPPKLQKALVVRLSRKRKAHQAKVEREAAKAAAQGQNSTAVPSSVSPEK